MLRRPLLIIGLLLLATAAPLVMLGKSRIDPDCWDVDTVEGATLDCPPDATAEAYAALGVAALLVAAALALIGLRARRD